MKKTLNGEKYNKKESKMFIAGNNLTDKVYKLMQKCNRAHPDDQPALEEKLRKLLNCSHKKPKRKEPKMES